MLHPFHCFSRIRYFQPSLFLLNWVERNASGSTWSCWYGCGRARTAYSIRHSWTLLPSTEASENYWSYCSLLCSTHFDGKTFALSGSQGLHMLLPVLLFPFCFSMPLSKSFTIICFQIWVPHFLYLALCICTSFRIHCGILSLGKTCSSISHAVTS